MAISQMEKAKLKEELYRALASPVGIILRTNDVNLLRQRLYTLRKEDEALGVLSFSPSPTDPNGELWITHNDKDRSSTTETHV